MRFVSRAIDALDNVLTDAKGARMFAAEERAFVDSVVLGTTYYSLNPKYSGYAFVFKRKSRSLQEPVTKCGTPASRIFREFAPLTTERPAGWKSIGQETWEASVGIGGPNIVGDLRDVAGTPDEEYIQHLRKEGHWDF
jgi:hypothetical protein